MPISQATVNPISHEERAFFARLAAMNTLFEATRSGHSAQSFASGAQSCDTLLLAFIENLKSSTS